MAVTIINPGLAAVPRMSRSKLAATDILSGRWVFVDATERCVLPGSQASGLFLALEGNLIHDGLATDFGSSPFASTKAVSLPSAVANNEVALAYGNFVYTVGAEGCDPAAALVNGALAKPDAFGRLIVASGQADATCVILKRVVDGGGLTTLLTVRSLGK
jgi:hypothetical protein